MEQTLKLGDWAVLGRGWLKRRRIESSSVTSARSNWVTWGMFVQAVAIALAVVLSVVSFAFIGFAIVIAAEGSLAFIGLSLDQTTWGKLINDGRAEIADHAYLSLIPATVMFITILAFNFVGDTFRGATAASRGSLARAFREREISEISCSRLWVLRSPRASCR